MADDPDIEITRTATGLMLAGELGWARLDVIGPGVVRIDLEGHGYTDFVPVLHEPLDASIRDHGQVFIGVDAEGMRSFERRFRYLWTEWIKCERDHIETLLVLTHNRAVEGAAVIINAVTNTTSVETCRQRDDFEARLDAAVARSRRGS